MILAIDVGNTNIVIGAFEGDTLVKNWRISTAHQRTTDEMGMFMLQLLEHHKLDIGDIDDVIVSSVVPQVMFSLERAISRYLKHEPIVIGPGVKTGINIKYDDPKEVGADRIVNAVAAYNIYGGPCIIIDLGTATTFCAVTEKADYLGGVICPGVKISLDALITHTSKLPKIELILPAKVIGKTTVSSMQSGMVYGYAGQIEAIVRLMKAEMGGADIKVIATGGLASMISQATDVIDIIDANLTLKGLQILYRKNR